MRIRQCLILVLSVVLATLMACDDEGDNFLDGSLVKNFNVKYKTIEAVLYPDGLAIEYVSSKDVAALRITINSTNAVLKKGKTYDLAKYGSVTRFNQYGELPDLKSGELTLTEFSEKEGALVAGDFNAIFKTDNEGSQTLRGAFRTKLIISPV